MRKYFSIIFTFVICFLFPVNAYAQVGSNDPYAYIGKVFPKLTELYKKELSQAPAHYIFAVDVSGSMIKNQGAVVGGLQPFFMALPNGDRVDVIPFGTDAMKNLMGYCGTIDPQIKDALSMNISNLYADPTYTTGFKSYTDVNAAVRAITDVIQNNRDFKINVIAMITDFRNEVKGDHPAEHQLTAEQVKDLKSRIDAATNGSYIRSIALHIDPASKFPGTCVDQLKNEVFDKIGNGLEIVPLHNPGPMIGQWFEQLKRDIMVLKLRAIIEAENSMNPVGMETDVNIDGVVKSRIRWSPSKLYPTLKIDSTYVSQPGFYFVNNKGAFRDTEDRDLDLKLGKIKNEKLLFHHFNDDVNLGVSLPTPYDDELKNLAITKPIPDTARHVDKWIFTFPLPFWLCCVIIALIIAYFIWVLNALGRNKKLKIRADISITDDDGEKIGNTRHPQGVNQLFIGKSGTCGCRVDEAEWQVEIKKVESNPFLPWTKPYFNWQKTQGEAYTGGKKGNCHGKFNARNTSVKLKCGPRDEESTNSVRIQILGLK